MRRRSRAGGKSPNAQAPKAAARKSRIARKVRARSSSAAREEAKVARLNRERDEALQQQRATAALLKVISRSTFDLQVVFETLVESAAKLCKADLADIWRPNGSSYRVAASYQTTAAQKEYLATLPITPGRGSCVGRTLLEAKIVHIPDIREDAEYALDLKKLGEQRTTLGVPLLRDGKPIGVIALIRNTVRPFTSCQIELVTTFADQAVIAIENARLLNELRESLQQQTATADVLKVISRSTFDLQAVLDTLVQSAARLCEADTVVITRPKGESFQYEASYGYSREYAEFLANHPARIDRGSSAGRALLERKTVHVLDALADPEYTYPLRSADESRVVGSRTLLGVPLLREGSPMGVMVLGRKSVRPFTDKQIELAETFADQAVIAIENTRLFEAEQRRTRELSESLEQQTATAEVLQVISSSPGDLQSVFTTMLENAVRICGAKFGNLWLYEGEFFRIGATTHGAPPAYVEYLRREGPFRADPRVGIGRLAQTKQTYQVADVKAQPTHNDKLRVATIELAGARTVLGVPMLKDGKVVGSIVIYRPEVQPFTERQVALVENFAAQAVIAIENTRLLSELRESLEQQTATADVLGVISSSPGDLQPVFASMLENAVRICDATFGNIYRWDGNALHTLASHKTPAAFAEQRRRSPHRPPANNPLGQMIATKKTVHVSDMAASEAYAERDPSTVAGVELGGVRTLLVVPMLKENELIGAFTLARQEVRPYTDKQVALVTNFAAAAHPT